MARKPKIASEDLKVKKLKFEKVAENLEVISAEDFLKNNFLPYSWSYNLDRALVDVSGLKPVHRRILYSMFKDNLGPTSHPAVVATAAGRVLAFHPHGNTSVEEAIKNLGRGHVVRVPLIDGTGDYGVPGKPGAASRYIKGRLSKAAWLNVEEISEKAVSMVPNYDGTQDEPVKIPVRWPVAVVNGGAGIAIGYASNMPSHNPTEVMNACKAIVKNPDLTDAQLQKIILGPDFNMGGLITSNDGVKDYLETGKGTFKIRGNYEIKPGARGTSRIEFYEIPFGSDPEKIIEDIHSAMDKGRLQDIANYKNLSDLKHPIRVVIDTKPSTNPKKVLQDLFKNTSLEVSFSVNMTTIVDSQPQQSGMKKLLEDFIEFRKHCIANKSIHTLKKRNDRLHLIEGLLLTLLDIDKAIAIIRGSEDVEAARAGLMKTFSLDQVQADFVLGLQLRRLTKMDKVELDKEKEGLEEEIAYLTSLLEDEEVLKTHLLKEFDETLKVIADERRTDVNNMTAEELKNSEKLLTRELRQDEKNLPVVVTRFADGRLLRTSEPFTYEKTVKKYAHGPIREQVKLKSQDDIVVVASDGTGYRLPLSYMASDRLLTADDLGLSLEENSSIVALAKAVPLKTDVGLVLGTRKGDVKLVKPEFPAKETFPVYALNDGDSIVEGRWLGRTLTNSSFVSITANSNILIYSATALRPTGHSAGGVKGQKLVAPDDEVIFFGWVPNAKAPDAFVLSQSDSTIKLTPMADIPSKSKGAQGVNLHKFRKGEHKLIKAVAGSELALSVSSLGNTVMLPPSSRRAATGADFKLMTDVGYSTVVTM